MVKEEREGQSKNFHKFIAWMQSFHGMKIFLKRIKGQYHLSFLMEKRDGMVNTRPCADERKQRVTKKEFSQIHNMDAIIPWNAETLSEKDKRAIASLIFLMEKRDGMVKARQCADGRK